MLRIRDLLRHPELGLEAVEHTGGLNRVIRWVHVTELPNPRACIGEDEPVLTNGLRPERQDPAAYTRALAEARAIGLVFGLRAVMPEVPRELVVACRDMGLPLLRLPVEVPFTAVTQAAATAQAEHRQKQLLEALRHSNAPTHTISAGNGVRGVLGVLAGPRQAPVALVDRLGTVGHAVHCPLSEADPRVVVEKIATGCQECALALSDGTQATLIPVQGFGGPDLAIVYGRRPQDIGPPERDGIEQTIRFLTVELAHQQANRGDRDPVRRRDPRHGAERAATIRGTDRAAALVRHTPRQPPGRSHRPTRSPRPSVRTGLAARRHHAVLRPAGHRLGGRRHRQDAVAIVGLHGSGAEISALADGLLGALRAALRRQRVLIGVGRVALGHAEARARDVRRPAVLAAGLALYQDGGVLPKGWHRARCAPGVVLTREVQP
ncbi:PucR family transcriptional regulator ligand-binding domain-containing protein [Streptomyces eurythermus]|uniref:PucR family transcriptional regulator ligand-binding domain-containing protein n=1 Tax=Streptomyces eurythermus TaxID=42237 RepID=UPI0036BCD6A2